MSETFKPGAARALFFATTAFAVSFAVWGLIAALAPLFTELYKLSATEKSLLIAIPVLLGSVGRIFAGMAADRFGGRVVLRRRRSRAMKFIKITFYSIGLTTRVNSVIIFLAFTTNGQKMMAKENPLYALLSISTKSRVTLQ